MLTKKKIKEIIESLFVDCNKRMINVGSHDVGISVWYQYHENALKDLIKILQVIDNTDFIKSNFEIWRDVGYYDGTDDIRMEFLIDSDAIKKSLK